MLKTRKSPAHVKYPATPTPRNPVTCCRAAAFQSQEIPLQADPRRLQLCGGRSIRLSLPRCHAFARGPGQLRDALSLLDQRLPMAGQVIRNPCAPCCALWCTLIFYSILGALATRMAPPWRKRGAWKVERPFESALQTWHHCCTAGPRAQRLTVPYAHPIIRDRELAQLFSPEDLQLYYQIAIQGRAELGLAPDERAGFAMTLLRMLAFAPGEPEIPASPPRPAAVRQTPGATPPALPSGSKKNLGDIDWPELVEQLGLTAMALELAKHCELVGRDGSRIELKIAQAHQRLLKGPSRTAEVGAGAAFWEP